MSIVAIIDIVNTQICFFVGIYTLYKLGVSHKDRHSPEAVTLIVSLGSFAWLINSLMAVMTVVDADLLGVPVFWSPNLGYTTCRLMHMIGWLYLLNLIRKQQRVL